MTSSLYAGSILDLTQIICIVQNSKYFHVLQPLNLEKFYGIGPYKFLERGEKFLTSYICVEKKNLKFQLICHAYNMKQQLRTSAQSRLFFGP